MVRRPQTFRAANSDSVILAESAVGYPAFFIAHTSDVAKGALDSNYEVQVLHHCRGIGNIAQVTVKRFY